MASLAHQRVADRHSERGVGLLTTRWLAAGLVLAHVALALLWSVVVPLGEGPDESGHVRYVMFLVQTNALPVQRDDSHTSDVPGEGHQPPLAYWLMQPAVRWLPQAERIVEVGGNPRFVLNGGDEPNAYFRSTRDSWPYQGVALAWHLARAFSAALGGITVWLTFLTTRRCFGADRLTLAWLPLGAAAMVGFNPQFIFAHALVSNDPLLFTLSSGLLYLCVVIATHGTEDRRGELVLVGLAGLILGLLLVTKQSALAFAPLPFLALLLRRSTWQHWLRDCAVVAGIALAVCWWWYVRNLRLYGDLFGLAEFQEKFATGGVNLLRWRDWTHGLWQVHRSSWGFFGWLTVPLVDGAYRAFAAFLALSLVGLAASVGRGWWTARGRAALVLVGAVALAFVWLAAFARVAGPVAWQGRFLFPAAPAFGILLACGLGAALPRLSALWTLTGLMLILAVSLPFGLIAPAYPSYVLPAQAENYGNVYGRYDVGYKRGIELRNIEVAREAIVGDTLDVALTWHALEQLDRNWTVFLHLVDERETIIAERNTQPLDGQFPTRGWVRGDWIRDPNQIALAGVPPGTYTLRIGLWDEQTERRLGVYDRKNKLIGDLVEIGPIVVEARQ